jgi:uroporphyrin-III C-methyltransferase
MLAFRMQARLTLVIGSNRLAASRSLSALEADSRVVVLAKGGASKACDELRWRAQQKELEVLDFADLAGPSDTSKDNDVESIEAFLDSHGPVALVCITDTMSGAPCRSRTSATQIYNACRQRNIPVNVTDMPDLCDFTFSSTHRFTDPNKGSATPLQVAVTTNGQGCRLAARIRRDMVAAVPAEAGVAVERMGRLRDLAKVSNSVDVEAEEHELSEEMTVLTPNRPVQQRSKLSSETDAERARRRMKWVAQISEYSPISRIATLTEDEMSGILEDEHALPALNASPNDQRTAAKLPQGPCPSSLHSLTLSPKPLRGRILLVGSGPGHPSLLTVATHTALTRLADLVLTDKLVPAAVLALIPKHVEVRVARKYPGNAEGAQMEMMEAAVEAANAGKTVVRVRTFTVLVV